jgi:hypothetical protein
MLAKLIECAFAEASGTGLTVAFPEEPKGMHWRRYNRLRRRHDLAFERSLMGLAKSAERLERWLSK